MESLDFPAQGRAVIDKYLPESVAEYQRPLSRPYVTLTYATSLDSNVSINNTQSTPLSGPSSKSMTHYLRTRHAAIVVGSGTAVADNPTLNSRLCTVAGKSTALQPRPVVLDRRARWNVSASSNVIQAASENRGKAPWIFVEASAMASVPEDVKSLVQSHDGEYLHASTFPQVLEVLTAKHITSVMIEGGATLIKELLDCHLDLIDAMIITIAPVYLGLGSVHVTPSCRNSKANLPAITMHDVQWLPLDNDVVMCGRPKAVVD